MVQAFTPVTSSNALQEYRLVVEQEYCKVIVNLTASTLEQLQVGQLIDQGLSNARRTAIDDQFSRYNLHSTDKFKVELEVCHSLLYYLQEVRHIQKQQIMLVGRAILEHERTRLGLSQKTAEAINALILAKTSPNPLVSDPHKLEQYDQHLLQAMQRDGSLLKETTQAELKLLQLVLGIADRDIPPAEKLQSAKGINYIRLWRLLKKQDWKAANEETHQRLVEAGGQEQRDLRLIDVERIPLIDLKTIDCLWSEFSNNRFGFSAQLSIWETATPDLDAFGKQVDWRRNNSWIGYDFIDFSLSAARGHLPAFQHMGWWCWVGGMAAILRRTAAAQTTLNEPDPDANL